MIEPKKNRYREEYGIFEQVRINKMELCYTVFSDILGFNVASAFYDNKVLSHTFGDSLFNSFTLHCSKSDDFKDTHIKIQTSIKDYMINNNINLTYDLISKPHFAKPLNIDLNNHRDKILKEILSGKYNNVEELSLFDIYNLFIDYYNYYRFMPLPNDYGAFLLESTVDYRFFILLISFISLHGHGLEYTTDKFKRIIPSITATRVFHKTDLKKTYVLSIYGYYKFKPGSTFHAVVSKIYEIFRDSVDNRKEIPNISIIPYDTGVPCKHSIKRYLTEDGIKANDFKEIHKGKRKYLLLQGE